MTLLIDRDIPTVFLDIVFGVLSLFVLPSSLAFFTILSSLVERLRFSLA
jgi:hypothetical protein